MVTAIPGLSIDDKRELLHLLNPVRSSRELNDAELETEIVRNLRRSLGLSGNIDLVQGFRRRMIELAPEFALVQPFDLRSDASVATELVASVFDQAAELAHLVDQLKSSQAARDKFADFEMYLKTKNSEHRREWLHRAAIAESTARTGMPDSTAATQAEESSDSHSATAQTLVKALSALVADVASTRESTLDSQQADALVAAAAPLGVVAAGAFVLAQRRRRREVESDVQSRPGEADDRREKTRSRFSPMVQAIVTTSAFLLARSGQGIAHLRDSEFPEEVRVERNSSRPGSPERLMES